MICGIAQRVDLAARRPWHVAVPRIDTRYNNKVIGVVCSGQLAAHREEIKGFIEKGIAQRPGGVWVCIERKSDALTRDILISLGVEPVVLPLLSFWKGEENDSRRVWRDGELLSLCDEVVVFLARTSNGPWRERAQAKPSERSQRRIHENLFLVELGAAPKRKGKK